jgi:hypothetical protein
VASRGMSGIQATCIKVGWLGRSANSLGANTSCDTQLEVLGLCKELGGEVCGVERRGDKHIGLRGFSVCPIRAIPAGRNGTSPKLTSAMFFWKTLFGPSLSSVTINLSEAAQLHHPTR